MSETDRATLLHAAELLEREANAMGALYREIMAEVGGEPLRPKMLPRWDDMLATAARLREMAG